MSHNKMRIGFLCIVLLTGCTTVEEADSSIPVAISLSKVPSGYDTEAQQQGSLEQFNYTTIDYNGDQHEENKFAIVYTPYGYDETKEYNILYLLHGHTGSATTWLGSPQESYEIKNELDHMIQDQRMEPMIIVSATYYDDNQDEETDNYDSYLVANFTDEFVKDLMPQVEAAYSTYAQSTSNEDLIASRDHRIFGGFSMGGVATWYQMMNAMSYARYYMPISGMLYWGPDRIDSEDSDWTATTLIHAITEQGFTKNDFFAYIATGSEDFAQEKLEEQLSAMEQHSEFFTFITNENESGNCMYGVGNGEEHNWQGRYRYIYHALPIFSQKMNA